MMMMTIMVMVIMVMVMMMLNGEINQAIINPVSPSLTITQLQDYIDKIPRKHAEFEPEVLRQETDLERLVEKMCCFIFACLLA